MHPGAAPLPLPQLAPDGSLRQPLTTLADAADDPRDGARDGARDASAVAAVVYRRPQLTEEPAHDGATCEQAALGGAAYDGAAYQGAVTA